ncbi:MAG TPA: peptidylprolyl isomerase [Candidatus Atribacteria bacterium]|nr:peptidylprolyl isomerase [Candidatus Atribacteria bacterium]
MAQAKIGDKVKVHYSGSLKDGTVFDSSLEKEPFEFTLGEDMVIPGFENAIIGMNEGETKTVSIPPEEAYGDYREELVVTVDRSQIPSDIEPRLGMVLQVRSREGTIANVIIRDITENSITLDGNHPLAGKELTFEIKLLEVVAN